MVARRARCLESSRIEMIVDMANLTSKEKV